ncbi:Maf1 regulator-domain-containing protein [Chytriomyces sp. MP71]|nr:Maf1 regulator-domain-containing protein [Chytriomyces sp. MP71]
MKYLEFSVLEEINTALSCVDTLDTRVFARLDAYSCKNTNEDKKLKHHIDEKYTASASTEPGSTTTATADGDVLVLMPIGSPALPGSFASAAHAHSFGDRRGSFAGGSFGAPPISSSWTGGAGNGYNGAVGGSWGATGGAFPTTASSFSAALSSGMGVSPVSPYGPLAQVSSRKTLFYLLATLNAAFPDYDFSDIKPELFMKVPMLKIVQESVKGTLFGMGLEGLAHNISNRLWEAIDDVIQLAECDIYSFNPEPELEPDSEEGNLWSFYYFFFNKKLKRMVFFTARAVSYMAPIQPEEMTNIYGESMGDEPMFDSEMGLSYEQYTMESMEV